MLALCPICSDEFYQAGDQAGELCPTCGCGLVPSTIERWEGGAVEQREPVRLIELCRPKLYPLAMLIKETLDQTAARQVASGGNSLSVLPQLAFSGELRVLVGSDQIEFARELYHAYFEGNEQEYSDDEQD